MAERKYKRNREDWGSARKQRNGRWQVHYPAPDGNRYPGPHTFDTLTDARAFLAATRSDIDNGKWRNPKHVNSEKFGAYASNWIGQRVSGKGQPLRPKTASEYRRQLARGLAPFADDRLQDITPARVRAWHTARAKAAPTSAGAESRLFRAVMNTAIEDGIIAKNPVPGNLTRTRTGIAHRPPTAGELGIILDTMPQRYRLAVLLSAYGGLRRGEWAALCRRDIEISDGRVRINVERAAQFIAGRGWIVGPPKSAEGVRTVPLPAHLTADVEAHLAEYVGEFPEDLLYAGRRGFEHPGAFNRAFDTARDAAGVRAVVREHDLRAYAATAFAVAGGTLAETMRLLGHSTTAAAMAYQHAATERMDALADRMQPPAPSNVTPIAAKKAASGK